MMGGYIDRWMDGRIYNLAGFYDPFDNFQLFRRHESFDAPENVDSRAKLRRPF